MRTYVILFLLQCKWMSYICDASLEEDYRKSLGGVLLSPKEAKTLVRTKIIRAKRGLFNWEEEEEEEEEREDERWRSNNCFLEHNCWNPFQPWGECSAPCGNSGVQVAHRSRKTLPACVPWTGGCHGSGSMTQPCNRFCHNGGSPLPASCSCLPGFDGTCCEIKIVCTLPVEPRYGNFFPLQTEYDFESEVTYTCNHGHVMTGSPVTRCVNVNATGTWDSAPPICTKVVCGPAPSIIAGNFEGYDFLFGGTVEYSCDPGYLLVGESRRQCEADAEWTKPIPECQPALCGKPVAIENGKMVLHYSDVEQALVMTVTCGAGFHLIGDKHSTCLSSGEWNNPAPVCQLTQGRQDTTLPPTVTGETQTTESPGEPFPLLLALQIGIPAFAFVIIAIVVACCCYKRHPTKNNRSEGAVNAGYDASTETAVVSTKQHHQHKRHRHHRHHRQQEKRHQHSKNINQNQNHHAYVNDPTSKGGHSMMDQSMVSAPPRYSDVVGEDAYESLQVP